MHDPADVRHRFRGGARRDLEDAVGRIRIGTGHVARRIDAHLDGGESRAEAVVHVASQAAAFLLAGQHELLAAALQLVVEHRRPHGGRGLPHDIREQTLIAA